MAVWYKCREVGLDCPFEVKAKSKEELTKKVKDHIGKEHRKEEISPEVKKNIEDAFKKYPAY